MKTVIKPTDSYRGTGIVCAILFYISFIIPSASFAGDIINIASIKVSKEYPASFVLDLERNDIITISYKKNGGNADLAQLLVQVIDLNQQDEEVAGSFSRSGRDYLAPYDGKYRVDFIYNGKGSGLIKQRNLDLSLNIDLDGYDGLKEGEAREVLHATNCVIEDSEENALRINYYLTKGDVINISSQDSKAAFLKLYISQLAKTISLAGGTEIVIPSNGTYSFKFYLQSNDDGSLFNWKELMSKNDFLFKDLSIFRQREADLTPIASSSNTVDTYGSSESTETYDSAGNLEETIDPAESYAIDIEKIMADGSRSSEEQTKAMVQAMKEQQELMLELANRKNIRTEITSFPSEIKMKLEPEFNFAAGKNASNRQCEIITLQPTNFNIWFYWIGVGDKAEEAYEEHNAIVTQTYRKPLSDAAAEYIYGKFGDSSVGKRNPSYPDEKKYPDYLFEDAEYAVVDFNNMRNFMAGRRYQQMNQRAKRNTYITSDNGFSARPALDGDIYFCACNNNKATPVNVLFKFFTIQYETEEY